MGAVVETGWSGRVAAIKGGWEGGKGMEGDRQEERLRGESNVSLPASQLMLGLWRASHGKPKTSGKWASVTSWKVISSVWLP